MTPKLQDLVRTLRQLFLFDRADLDFGLYRIMNARRAEVDAFLQSRLPEIARDRLGAVKKDELERLEVKVREAIQQAANYGVADPENAPPVLAARRALALASDLSAVEDQVYSLLVTFFSRYYDDGDFITRRRYSALGRERYMIPYDGEEVKLVWANMDQYYVKSDECLRDYRFRLPPLPEGEPAPAPESDTRPAVLFKLVEADVAKDNVKSAGGERRFALAVGAEHPVTVSEDGKLLTIPFVHTEHPKGTKQSDLLDAAETALLPSAAQADLLAAVELHVAALVPAAFADLLGTPIANKTDPKKARTLLRFHLDQYTARNTYDYFIHKDLGGFFTRELDYFLKSEVLEIEDLIGQSPEAVDMHLRKVRAVRDIAQSVITFLANIENFQKKLWLKKKFVVETHWCLTLDRVPEALFPLIAQNDAQMQAWVKLGFIEEAQIPGLKKWLLKCAKEGKKHESQDAPKDLFGNTDSTHRPQPSAFSVFMVIDTAFFDEAFKQKLLASVHDIDAQTDGLLIHSENFQALTLLHESYREQVKCIFIDPPYNTDNDGFVYKDNLRDSSWLSLMETRILLGLQYLAGCGSLLISIGDEEQEYLASQLRQMVGKHRFFATLVWEKKKKGTFLSGKIAKMKDYILCVSKNDDEFPGLIGEINSDTETYPCVNPDNPRDVRILARGLQSKHREKNITLQKGHVISSGNMTLVLKTDMVIHNGFLTNDVQIEGNWRYSQASLDEYAQQGALYITQELYVRRIVNTPRHKVMKDLLQRNGEEGEADFRQYDTINVDRFGWGTNEDANDELHQILGEQYAASYPKPSKLVTLLLASARHATGIVLDYFAGSGTTGHAVLNLNRADDGTRKYILVEMGEHFDTVLKPRIQKVVFSKDWKDGKPTDPASGVSHCFKYLRLESYEDTLNNLILHRREAQQQALALSDSLNSEYLLGYFLDTETTDSPSLLNVMQFSNPWDYTLKIAEKAVGESRLRPVDLIETFNYLIGLKVARVSEPQAFVPDGEPRRDADGRLRVKRLRKATAGQSDACTFQTIEGVTLAGEKTLIVWRTLSSDPETDAAILDAYLQTLAINTREQVLDVLYVNGDHTLDNLATTAADGLSAARVFKVRRIETEFRKRMFAGV